MNKHNDSTSEPAHTQLPEDQADDAGDINFEAIYGMQQEGEGETQAPDFEK